MVAGAEMLKTTEAAVVSRVALRDVNRAIDEGILPDGFFTLDNGRHVVPAACMLIAFYFASARHLTAEERLYAIRAAERRLRRWDLFELPAVLKEDWTVQDEFLTIDLAPFVKSAAERLDRLAAARNMVEFDIPGGPPVISGTRVPVHDVAACVAAGHSTEHILTRYPELDAGHIELATLYAEAYPARGRPRRAGERAEGAAIVGERRVARRRASVSRSTKL